MSESVASPMTPEAMAKHLRATLEWLRSWGLRDDVALKVVHEHVYGTGAPVPAAPGGGAA